MAPPAVEVFRRFLRLGCVAFGGPVAHLGYFRREFVTGARWLDDAAFTEIVALCSVLPGPTSSQVAMLLGAKRAGPLGALAAWLGFTFPAAIILTVAGLALRGSFGAPGGFWGSPIARGTLEGCAGAAGGVVVTAVVQLGRAILRTRIDGGIAVLGFALALVTNAYAPSFQWLAPLAGAIAGGVLLRKVASLPVRTPAIAASRNVGYACGGAFVVLLLGLPIVAGSGGDLDVFSTFYRAGALVFGGGHVVLPFLQHLAGTSVPSQTFFAGYGITQALPGPLFAFAAFLGAASFPGGGPVAALVALVAIFLPSFLLLGAVVPLWRALRELPHAAAVLAGANAAVVGMLAGVVAGPIRIAYLQDHLEAAIALVAIAALLPSKVPIWVVVLLCAILGTLARAVRVAF